MLRRNDFMIGVVSGLLLVLFSACSNNMAPKCDDERATDSVLGMLDKEKGLTEAMVLTMQEKRCSELKNMYESRKRALDTAFNNAAGGSWRDYDDNMQQVKKKESEEQSASVPYFSCAAQAQQAAENVLLKGKQYNLTVVRTVGVNKDTGTYTCKAELETAFHVKADVAYKTEITDGGKNYYVTVSWSNLR